eukprot:gene3494-2985_t
MSQSQEGECAAAAALAVHVSVCAGDALAGGGGSQRFVSVCQRFLTVGRVCSLLSLLVDAWTQQDLQGGWTAWVREYIVFEKRGSPQPCGLWEVVGELAAFGVEGEEWLYSVANIEADPWQDYNHAAWAWAHPPPS